MREKSAEIVNGKTVVFGDDLKEWDVSSADLKRAKRRLNDAEANPTKKN